jgi:hypothetical protein
MLGQDWLLKELCVQPLYGYRSLQQRRSWLKQEWLGQLVISVEAGGCLQESARLSLLLLLYLLLQSVLLALQSVVLNLVIVNNLKL